MTRLLLVRHGEAAAGWNEDVDPGLSAEGRRQAEDMAAALAPAGPMPIVVSPLKRTRETAAPLEALWEITARVEPAVGEIPSPTNDLEERGDWLMRLMRTPQTEWPDDLQQWRRSVLAALTAIDQPSVVVSHFVAIRAAVGTDAYLPDYCSRTMVETEGEGIRVVELGHQRTTAVR